MLEKNFIDQLKDKKIEIAAFLLEYLRDQEQFFIEQGISQNVFSKIKTFAVSGKMARGGIFLLMYEQLTKDQNIETISKTDQLSIAAALELTQSGILIHDDIADQDQIRRGQNSVWQQFRLEAEEKKLNELVHYGQSLAIFAGNICLQLGQNLLKNIKVQEQIKEKILEFFNQEIIRVNFAQMLDSELSLQNQDPTLDEIMNLYRLKTGRYTYSLPLCLAANLAKLRKNETQLIEKFGEELGIIFQIKDDEIGIFTAEEISGKSAGLDIKNGKKNIYYYFLDKNLQHLPAVKKEFGQFFGQENLTPDNLKKCQLLYKKYSQDDLEKLIQKLRQQCLKRIEKLKNNKSLVSSCRLLEELLQFNFTRKF